MTLTTAQISALTRLISVNRHDWDDAGILTQIEHLAADPRPWPELEHQALTAASNPKATTPAAILWATSTPQTTVQPNDGWRTKPGPECPEHHNPNWRTSDGMWACCWTEQFTDASDPTSPSMAPGEPQ